MTDAVDELFGDGEGQPEPRTRTVYGLLGSGVLLSLIGLACSAAPGGLLVLWAWAVADTDMQRVDVGYLPVDTRGDVRRAQQATVAGLGLVVLVFLLQGVLLCAGFYQDFWAASIAWAVAWMQPGEAGAIMP